MAAAMTATAQIKTEIKTMNQAGPYAVSAPLALDTVDVKGNKFDEASLMNNIALTSPATGRFDGQVLPSLTDSKSVGLLSFYVNNRDYLKGKIEVKGPKHYKLYVDGHPATPELKLAPDHHTFTIQYLAEPKDTDSIRVTIDAPKAVAYTLDAKHPLWCTISPTASVCGISLFRLTDSMPVWLGRRPSAVDNHAGTTN